MANQNSVIGYQNLPAQVITNTTETALLVPAAGAYSTLPSPALPAGVGLYVSVPSDIQGSEFDGHPFKVRLSGKVFTGGSYTFQVKLYQVPAAIVAANTAATVANDNVAVSFAASSAFTGWANFVVESVFLFDTSSAALNYVTSSANSVKGAAVTATGSNIATGWSANPINVLNFIPSFTFGTGNAANAVTVSEFVIDRV